MTNPPNTEAEARAELLFARPGHCGTCQHWKNLRPDLGMCQCPSEAIFRGAKNMRGWFQSEPSDLCRTREFTPRLTPETPQ